MTAVVLLCKGALPQSKISLLQLPRDHSFKPEDSNEGNMYFFFFFFLMYLDFGSLIGWKIFQKKKEFHVVVVVFYLFIF